jgi:hypothetical protein
LQTIKEQLEQLDKVPRLHRIEAGEDWLMFFRRHLPQEDATRIREGDHLAFTFSGIPVYVSKILPDNFAMFRDQYGQVMQLFFMKDGAFYTVDPSAFPAGCDPCILKFPPLPPP